MARTDIRSLRREQILDVADRLMSERGWTGVTFAAICREAGVSNGVLTYHFEDKEDLLLSLFERQMSRVHEEVFVEAFADPNMPLVDRLRALVRHMLRMSDELSEFRLLVLHFLSLASERPDLVARLQKMDEGDDDPVAAGLCRDAVAGIVRRDPAVATDVVMSVFLGLGLLRGVFNVDPPPEEIVAMLHGYLTGEPCGAPPMERGP